MENDVWGKKSRNCENVAIYEYLQRCLGSKNYSINDT